MLEIFPFPAVGDASPKAVPVDLWTWDLDAPAPELARVQAHLSPSEGERAQRFVTDQLRSRWTMARGMLREILGAYLGLEPGALEFDLNPQGKPSVAPREGSGALHFSLSHSHGVAGLAVSGEAALGFDLEVLGRAPLDVAESVFSPSERAELAGYAGPERHAAFYRGWTRKEAFVKALGMGLSYPLDSFEVSFSRTEPRVVRADGSPPDDWRLVSIESKGRWVGALAAITSGRSLDITPRKGRPASFTGG